MLLCVLAKGLWDGESGLVTGHAQRSISTQKVSEEDVAVNAGFVKVDERLLEYKEFREDCDD